MAKRHTVRVLFHDDTPEGRVYRTPPKYRIKQRGVAVNMSAKDALALRRIYAKSGTPGHIAPKGKHHRASVMSILKRDHFKEVLKDAGKRGKGPRLKGIE